SDIVLFSAAIPYQGGTHHVNEQPPAYWADIFEKEGFVCFDILREKLWENKDICPWYIQNILLFVSKDKQDMLTKQGFTPKKPPYIIHPGMWEPNKQWFDYLLLTTKNYMCLRDKFAKISFLKAFYKKFIK
ncbi:hypothetical protein, partial [Helicobacter sp. CLO-3]|uniref:hypothetical protein n=3 Tax=unclassified Helicobacter TaxID=2593540 RepID=UPI000AEC3406